MSFTPIPLPSVWDVPVAAGVSGILGQSVSGGISSSVSTALGGVVQNWTTSQAATKWGIYDSTNTSIATAAHVLSVDYEVGYAVPNAPLTDGSFASYNKVKRPYNARVTLVCDGKESGNNSISSMIKSLVGDGVSSDLHVRSDFLNALDRVVQDTNLYSVYTPEKTYLNANIVAYRFRRDVRQGVTMIVVEIMLQEIRTTGTLWYSTTRESPGAQLVQNGTVQAQALPTQANSVISDLQDQHDNLPLTTISQNLPS